MGLALLAPQSTRSEARRVYGYRWLRNLRFKKIPFVISEGHAVEKSVTEGTKRTSMLDVEAEGRKGK